MPAGKGQLSSALSRRFNVSRTVEGASPRRRATSRVGMPVENFNRMISRAWRIETLSADIDRSPGLPKERPKQANGRARPRSRPRAGSFRYGGRHYLEMVGGIIPLRRATSSRYD